MKASQAYKLASEAITAKLEASRAQRKAEARNLELLTIRDSHLAAVRNELVSASIQGQSDHVLSHGAWMDLLAAQRECSQHAEASALPETRLPKIFLPLTRRYTGYSTSASAAHNGAQRKEHRLREALLSGVMALEVRDVQRFRDLLQALQNPHYIIAGFPKARIAAVEAVLDKQSALRFRRDFMDLLRWHRLAQDQFAVHPSTGVWIIWDWLRALDTEDLTRDALEAAKNVIEPSLVEALDTSVDSADVLQNPQLLEWLASVAQPTIHHVFDTISAGATAGHRHCLLTPLRSGLVMPVREQVSVGRRLVHRLRFSWLPPNCDSFAASVFLSQAFTSLGYTVSELEGQEAPSLRVSW